MGPKYINGGSGNVVKTSFDLKLSETNRTFGHGIDALLKPPHFELGDNIEGQLDDMEDLLSSIASQTRARRLLRKLPERAKFRAERHSCRTDAP
uniref:Uncharacterized protein n=1 Tax=Mesocestoides corti TaxID=53468 RepID=A0A5K3FHI1_MESCO